MHLLGQPTLIRRRPSQLLIYRFLLLIPPSNSLLPLVLLELLGFSLLQVGSLVGCGVLSVLIPHCARVPLLIVVDHWGLVLEGRVLL